MCEKSLEEKDRWISEYLKMTERVNKRHYLQKNNELFHQTNILFKKFQIVVIPQSDVLLENEYCLYDGCFSMLVNLISVLI